MVVEIIVNGVKRTYINDYYALHCNDWNEIVRLQMDDLQDAEINKMSYADTTVAG
jgi:hypothetical protein